MQTTDESLQFRKLCLETEFFCVAQKSCPEWIVHSDLILTQWLTDMGVKSLWKHPKVFGAGVHCESAEKEVEERLPRGVQKNQRDLGILL